MKRFLCAFLFVIFIAAPAFSAGYSCPAYMKYTSCNSGYYMTKSGAYNGTPAAGNACSACPAGYSCAGGTANAVPLCSSDCTYGATQSVSCGSIANGTYNGTQTCNATKNGVSGCYTWGGTTGCTVNCNGGYVPNGASCENCGINRYCNNNTRYTCPANDQDLSAVSGGTIIKRNQNWTSGQPNATYLYQCRGNTYIQVATGKYLAECAWDGTNYFNACEKSSYLWYEAATGYYLTGYEFTSEYPWYNAVTACTNKPANSSYSGAGSPDTNNCPWTCNSGYQKTPSNTCILCPSGYSVNASGQCVISVPAGKYIATANATSGTTCLAGYYCPGATIVYGSTGGINACTGRAQYSAAGAGACSTVSAGYYTTGCNSSNNNCTGQAICNGTTYCTGGVANECPSATTYQRTSFPDSYYSPVITSTSVQSNAGQTSTAGCVALAWMTSPRGTLYEYVSYNASSGKYDKTSSYGWSSVSAGYYLTDKGGCGTFAYYLSIKDCPTGSYCPGKADVVCNAGNVGTVHTTTFGLETCPGSYSKSALNSKSAAYCYLTTASTKYVASAAAGEVTCAAGSACPGGTTVYYAAGVGATTGGIAACTGATYSGAGAGSCAACPSGYTANTASNKTAVSQCQINVGAGQYMATAGSNGSVACAAGTFKAAHTVNYGTTSACAACTGATYSGAGVASCSACPAGYTANTASNKTAPAQCQISCPAGTRVASAASACTSPAGGWFTSANLINYGQISPVNYCTLGFTSSGTTAAAHDSLSDCLKTVAAGNYIPATTEQARYIRIKSTGSTANGGHHISEIQAFASSNATGTNLLAGKNTLTPGAYLPGAATDGSWFIGNYTECSQSVGCIWDIGSKTTIGSIKFAMYTDGRTYYNVEISVSDDNNNWTVVFGPMNILTPHIDTTVGEVLVVSSLDTPCVAGTASPSKSVAQGSTSVCPGCAAGTFALSGSASCTSCAINSYSAASAGACIACQNGTSTSAAGSASCNSTCANKNAYATNWTTATWTNNSVANSCTLSGCTGGYYVASNACTTVGSGYWSAAASGARTACSAGLTTIGYGAGADEAADCGRILNIGADKVYLRSAKKTTPSLNINVGGATYYGNMSTATKGALRINSGGTKYSVHDDSM